MHLADAFIQSDLHKAFKLQSLFFTRENKIIDSGLLEYFSWKQWIEVKNVVMIYLFFDKHFTCYSLQNMLIDGLEWCGWLVDYCDVFISCLDSHSDGTHSLQGIHWWASYVMLHFSQSDEETNSSTFRMAWGWVTFQPFIIFGWTIPLRPMTWCREWGTLFCPLKIAGVLGVYCAWIFHKLEVHSFLLTSAWV